MQSMTPSLRFPLPAGGTERVRCSVSLPAGGTEEVRLSRFPSRSGGNLKEGGIGGLWRRDWHYSLSVRVRVVLGASMMAWGGA